MTKLARRAEVQDRRQGKGQGQPQAHPIAVVVSSRIISGGGFEADVTALHPEVVHYLLQYGFAKSIQDASAGIAKIHGTEVAREKREVRYRAILDGSLIDRIKAQGTPMDRLVARIVRERIALACAARGIKPPAGEDYVRIASGYALRHGEELRVEAEHRIALGESLGDLADIGLG